MKKQKWLMAALIAVGIILFVVIAFIIVRSTATVKAVVPNQPIGAGTRITEDMITVIDVPVDTPQGYITDPYSLIGQKIKINADANQLLYPNAFMASWDNFASGKQIPDDYIVTAIQVPSERAVAGLITAGDYIDILGIPKSKYQSTDATSRQGLLDSIGPIGDYSYGTEDGVNLYWLFANVLVLETDSTLSEQDNASLSGILSEDSTGNYYIIALDYSDYMKLRLSEIYFDFWLNIVPDQNGLNPPMTDEMKYAYIRSLCDAMNQSKFNEEGERIIPELTEKDKEEAMKNNGTVKRIEDKQEESKDNRVDENLPENMGTPEQNTPPDGELTTGGNGTEPENGTEGGN